MKVLIIAVGQKMPNWAQESCEDYLKRFPADWRVDIKTVKTESRTSGKLPSLLMEAEAQRITQIITSHTQHPYIIALDEHGTRQTSMVMASSLQSIQRDGNEAVLVIGGPDGLCPKFKKSTHALWRISDLTLPHAMVRVLLVEQLYRCWSILNNHPYHRE